MSERNETIEALRQLRRDPFRDKLADLLDSGPDPEAIKEFAQKYPDRWAQACAIMGRLGGYTEKTETTHNLNVTIAHLSDAEVLERLAQYGIDPLELDKQDYERLENGKPGDRDHDPTPDSDRSSS